MGVMTIRLEDTSAGGLSQLEATPSALSRADSTRCQPQKARILVVDDDEKILRLIEKVLRQHGYQEVVCLSQAEAVLGWCREHRPDLVLLDLNMPGLSGFEILQQLQQETYDFEPPPVIVLTGERGRESRIEALKLGASDYIVKPFDFEVVARIKNTLERRLMSKQLHGYALELEDRVRERTAEVEEAHLETVKRLGVAAEYRDDDTGVHVVRMSSYVAHLAGVLGQDQRRAELIRWATKLHDIGKIAIPDMILLKPGKLTFEEFEAMKQHTVVGAKILSGAQSALLQMAEVIALNHHEKWDGSGYPNGRAGEAIPWVARVVTVCDVFDALTSERPYKSAWSVEDAVAEMRRCRGSHFDPDILDAFLDNLESILQLKEAASQDGEFGSSDG